MNARENGFVRSHHPPLRRSPWPRIGRVPPPGTRQSVAQDIGRLDAPVNDLDFFLRHVRSIGRELPPLPKEDRLNLRIWHPLLHHAAQRPCGRSPFAIISVSGGSGRRHLHRISRVLAVNGAGLIRLDFTGWPSQISTGLYVDVMSEARL